MKYKDVLKKEKDKCKLLQKKIGISEKEINDLSEIDLEQKIMEKADLEEKEELEENEIENIKEDDNKGRQVNKKQVDAIGSLNEINLEAPIDKWGHTLSAELGLEEYSKLLVVHAYQIPKLTGEKREDIKFGFIAQKKDGTYEAVPKDKIRMYRGASKELTTISDEQEDQTVETRYADYMFETQKDNKKLAVRQNDPYGIPEVYLAQATHDNEAFVGQELQDRYDGTTKSSQKHVVEEIFNPNHGEYQADKIRSEVKLHEAAGCERVGLEEADGDLNTGYSVHDKDGNHITKEYIIAQIMDKCRITRIEDAERYYSKICEEHGSKNITAEEIIEESQEIAAEEAGIPTRKR